MCARKVIISRLSESVDYIRPQLFLTAPVGDFAMYNEYKIKCMLLFIFLYIFLKAYPHAYYLVMYQNELAANNS